MKYISLIPLVLGTLVYAIFSNFKKIKFSKLSFDLYNLTIYTLILRNLTQGILELSGRTSKLTIIFLILSIILILSSFISFIIKQIKE